MPTRSVISVQRILIAMIEQDGAPPSEGLDAKREVVLANSARGKYVWQVRHSGLLGLKYLVAVKGDLLRGAGGGKASNGVKKEEGEDVVMKDEGSVKSEDIEMKVDESEPESTLLKGVVDAALLG